jgi:alpha-tubulin suppressor-like RCC1 family protein
MALNFGKLELDLAAVSKNLTKASDKLLFSKILSKLQNGSVTVVGSFSLLPVLSSVADGSLYFTESDGALYVADSSISNWRLLSKTYYGAIWGWGGNARGQLGDNTILSRSSPILAAVGFTDWCQVSAGSSHTAAVRTNGTLWAWGCAGTGRLGDNTATDKSSPVSVVGGFTDWCQVSGGTSHTAAVRTNGTLWAWGNNLSGRLGDNTITSKSSPVSVVGGFTDWCQVSVSVTHAISVRTNCTIWAWGDNTAGILGDNTIVSKSSPVSVVGGFTDWCQVSAGNVHTAAVRTNGTIWGWGCNTSGRIGDNTTVNKSSPVSVVGGFTDWCQVSAGYNTAAIRTNGTIWAWGPGICGMLGDNTTVNKSSPVSVVGGFTDWCQVSVGCSHTSAVRTNGTIWSWGCNSYGALGNNDIVSRSSPVSVVGGFTNWKQVSASNNTTLALQVKSV